MRPAARKLTRFFVINPKTDRRYEARFHANENVVVKFTDNGTERVYRAIAFELGKTGMRIELSVKLAVGTDIQIAFPNTPDNVNCFGRVAWVAGSRMNQGFEIGVAVSEWHGITDGAESWKKFVGPHSKKDRRIIKR